MKGYTPQAMSKQQQRDSMSGSTQSNSRHSDGRDRSRDYQHKSMNIREFDRRASQGPSPSPMPFPTNRRLTFSPGNKPDAWTSLSEVSFSPANTQPVQKFPGGRQAPMPPPYPSTISSTAPAADGRPIFSNATRISVPTDARSDPAWIARQIAKVQKQAAEKPSFSAPAEPLEDSSASSGSPSDDEKKEQAKVLSKKNKKKNKKERKEKKGKKAKNAKIEEKQESEKQERKENKDKYDAQEKDSSKDPSPAKVEGKSIAYEVPVESSQAAEKREQKNKARRKREAEKKALAEATGRKLEGVQGATKIVAAGLKRKFDDPNSNVAFNSRLDTETQAIKRLRESLPSTRLSLVSQKLEQECGTEPTAMAVLVEAARETILDLARGQMNTLAGGASVQDGLSGAVLRMLNEQKGRLDKLESAVEKPKAIEVQVVKDTNTDVAEDVKDGDVESVHEAPSEEDTSEESSSSDSESEEEDADYGSDEDDSDTESESGTGTGSD